jgi:putative inorganic carbon (hco3(-)) transporter
VVLLSSFTAWNPAVSWANMRLYISWVIIYIMITLIVNTEKRFLVFMSGYILWCLKMSQHGARSFVTGFGSYGTSCTPGWFQNSGECGIQMAMFLPVAIFFILALRPYWSKRKYWLMLAIPLSAAMTIIATSSRGAQIGMAAIGVLLIMQTKHRFRTLILVGLLGMVAWHFVPESQKQRFAEAGEDDTSLARLQYWADAREIMSEYPMLGIGYNNWLPYYRMYYNPTGELPHNIFYEAGAELGFIGLFAFIGLIGGTLYMNRKTRRMAKRLPGGGEFASNMALAFDGALIAYLITGYFVTVLYYPFMWINLSMVVALHCSTEYELRRARAGERAALLAARQAELLPGEQAVWRPQHG